jgi:hypothetical protein
MNLRRALARLVGDRTDDSLPDEDAQAPPSADGPAEPGTEAGRRHSDLAITFTMVERPRDES